MLLIRLPNAKAASNGQRKDAACFRLRLSIILVLYLVPVLFFYDFIHQMSMMRCALLGLEKPPPEGTIPSGVGARAVHAGMVTGPRITYIPFPLPPMAAPASIAVPGRLPLPLPLPLPLGVFSRLAGAENGLRRGLPLALAPGVPATPARRGEACDAVVGR